MSVKVCNDIVTSGKSAMAVYVDVLKSMAAEDDKFVVLDADLARSAGTAPFGEAYPERHLDVGIAEANMMCIAAGMALRGYHPVINSFAPFAVRRCLDQIYVSGAYSKSNVKIVGVMPGVLATATGGTHMAFDDVADCISIPGMTVIEPSDNVQLACIVKQAFQDYGMCYVRFDRTALPTFYEEGSEFHIGKSVQLRDGKDLTIIATGAICLKQAMLAAEELDKEGIHARVLDMFTIKPLDEEVVVKAAAETGAIVTIENANERCGMGSMVAHTVARKKCVPVESLGSQDRLGEVGDLPYLMKKFNLMAADIIEAAHKVLERKSL